MILLVIHFHRKWCLSCICCLEQFIQIHIQAAFSFNFSVKYFTWMKVFTVYGNVIGFKLSCRKLITGLKAVISFNFKISGSGKTFFDKRRDLLIKNSFSIIMRSRYVTAQKMKSSIKDFFSCSTPLTKQLLSRSASSMIFLIRSF